MSHGGRETQSLASTVSMAFGVILYTTESLRIAPSIHWIAKLRNSWIIPLRYEYANLYEGRYKVR